MRLALVLMLFLCGCGLHRNEVGPLIDGLSCSPPAIDKHFDNIMMLHVLRAETVRLGVSGPESGLEKNCDLDF